MAASLPTDKQRTLLACCRPDADDHGDKKMREALNSLEADSTLKESFNTQAEFDRPLAALVQAVPLPENFDAEISTGLNRASHPQFSWRGLLREPAFWAVLLAFTFLVAWGGDMLYERAVGFPGDETVSKLIEGIAAAEAAGQHDGGPGTPAATRFEAVSTESGKLGDTLFLKHNVEAFQVPAPFAHTQTISYRVLEKNDTAVTQVKVLDHKMTFLIFPAGEFGVDITPPGRWKFLSGEGWAAAAQVTDNVCFVAICPGTKEEMQTYIQEGEDAAARERVGH
jgi:hypothetical protein